MDNPFLKDFDTIFEEIKTDYVNQEVACDKGSVAQIKSACLASALWGIYKGQGWVSEQIFPDSATFENLQRHAAIRQIYLKTNETKEELLARYLADIREPAAGGNANDYETWALEVDGVKKVKTIPLIYGYGTVGVAILGENNTTPTTLLSSVADYIETKRPVTAKEIFVIAADVVNQDVDIQIVGTGADLTVIKSNIENYLNIFEFGETLYLTQFISIAKEDSNVKDVIVQSPSSNITISTQQIIRAGNVNIHT